MERAYEDLAGQADREDLEAWVKKFDRILFMPQRGAFFRGGAAGKSVPSGGYRRS